MRNRTDPDPTPTPAILPPGRLDRLARRVATLYRQAHLTAPEARYVHRRARGYARISGAGPARSRRLPAVLTAEQIARVLAHAYRDHPRDGLIVRTLFETGLRVSEFVAATVAAVDWTERTILVRGKGGVERRVLFTADLGQQLRVHLAGRERGYLFEPSRGGRFSVRRVQQIVQGSAQRAGIAERIHPHVYRHSMATTLRNQGVPLDTIQRLLGHADPRTTEIYTHLALGTARQEYDQAMQRGGS